MLPGCQFAAALILLRNGFVLSDVPAGRPASIGWKIQGKRKKCYILVDTDSTCFRTGIKILNNFAMNLINYLIVYNSIPAKSSQHQQESRQILPCLPKTLSATVLGLGEKRLQTNHFS